MIRHALTVVFVAAIGTACEPRAAQLCEMRCECTGCTDAELDECVENAEFASSRPCGEAYDALVECTIENFVCTEGGPVPGCEAELDAYGGCISLSSEG